MEKQKLNKDDLDKIIEEITKYSIDLEEDPTQPELGNKYINRVLANCRAYQNRVAYYLQIIRNEEREIKKLIRVIETDVEMKSSDMLAQDPIVKKQPNISDRKALVASRLASEYQEMSDQKLLLLDLQETSKIVKMQYDHLKQTTRDIQVQRTLVRDEKEMMMSGGDGMSKPSAPNNIYQNGMPSAIVPGRNLNPSIPLNRSELSQIPKPIDDTHLHMMERFLSTKIEQGSDKDEEENVQTKVDLSLEPKLEDILL